MTPDLIDYLWLTLAACTAGGLLGTFVYRSVSSYVRRYQAIKRRENACPLPTEVPRGRIRNG
jgi:hypothetical protein